MEYHYRIKFGLTEGEMKRESWESIRRNLVIMSLYAEKERLEAKQ